MLDEGKNENSGTQTYWFSTNYVNGLWILGVQGDTFLKDTKTFLFAIPINNLKREKEKHTRTQTFCLFTRKYRQNKKQRKRHREKNARKEFNLKMCNLPTVRMPKKIFTRY